MSEALATACQTDTANKNEVGCQNAYFRFSITGYFWLRIVSIFEYNSMLSLSTNQILIIKKRLESHMKIFMCYKSALRCRSLKVLFYDF